MGDDILAYKMNLRVSIRGDPPLLKNQKPKLPQEVILMKLGEINTVMALLIINNE